MNAPTRFPGPSTGPDRLPRRAALARTALIGSLMLAALPAAAQNGEMTVVSWGGALQDAQRVAWFEPAAKELGITIKEDTVSGLADVRTQVQSGAVTWDLVELGSFDCAIGAREGMFEPLDLSLIDTANIDSKLYDDHWVAVFLYSTVLSWNTETYADKAPASWADFFDVEAFPGTRSMYNDPGQTMEVALLADGVPPDQLYPLDVERAFAKLEQIKPHIVAWWDSGAASAQLLMDGEADMVAIWNGRAQTAIKEGATADLTWDQQVLDYDCMVIPKGAPNKDLAMQALAKFMSAEYQARLPLHINYGPVNTQAFTTGTIPPEVADELPSGPKNSATAAVLDPNWWLDNREALLQRFQTFVQE